MTESQGLVTLSVDGKPLSWKRSVRGDRSDRRIQQDNYIKTLALQIKLAAEGQTFDGPVTLSLAFDYKHQRTHISVLPVPPKKGIKWRAKRADIDNLAKLIMEALQLSGVVKDDSQVAQLIAKKYE